MHIYEYIKEVGDGDIVNRLISLHNRMIFLSNFSDEDIEDMTKEFEYIMKRNIEYYNLIQFELSYIITNNFYYIHNKLYKFSDYNKDFNNRMLDIIMSNNFRRDTIYDDYRNEIIRQIDCCNLELFKHKNMFIRDIIISQKLNIPILKDKIEILKNSNDINYIKKFIDNILTDKEKFNIIKTYKNNESYSYEYYLGYEYIKNDIIDRIIDEILIKNRDIKDIDIG